MFFFSDEILSFYAHFLTKRTIAFTPVLDNRVLDFFPARLTSSRSALLCADLGHLTFALV